MLTSEFHAPRALYLYEAVFTHLAKVNGLPFTPKIVAWPVDGGCPRQSELQTEALNARDEETGMVVNINQQTLLQRAEAEQGYVKNEASECLSQHIKDRASGKILNIPVPPTERLDQAQQQINEVLNLARL